MKDKKQKNNLRDLIINNPRSQQRKKMREIERHIEGIDKAFAKKSKSEHGLWRV